MGRYGIVEEDLADLRQQWIAAIIRTADYQKRDVPCFSTYVGRLVDQLIANEIRFRKAAKRDYSRVAFSLDEAMEDGDGGSDAEFSADSYFGLVSDSDPLEESATNLDVDAFLSSLPDDLRALAEGLKHNQMEHVHEILGISRRTAFRRLNSLREAAARFFENS